MTGKRGQARAPEALPVDIQPTLPRKMRVRHQALFDGLREVLPLLRLEADTFLAAPDRLQHVWEQRHARTAAPETLLDGTVIIPPPERRARISTEASLAYLLAQVTREALRQSYQQLWPLSALYGLIPELTVYDWFLPTPDLAHRVDALLHAAALVPLPVQLAGELYEGSLSPDERKGFGQYYTPLAVVRHLFDQAEYLPINPSIARPILDVATGCGVFLAEAARRLARALWEASTPLDRLCHTLGALLHGYDLHPFAIIATKIYVFASVVDELGLAPTDVALLLQRLRLPGIRCADTLVEAMRGDPQERLPAWVVGNPPYGTCQEGEHLDSFRAVLHGRANLYQLFLSAGLTRCVPGGRIAFLVPESLRAGRFFDRLRRRIAAETSLVATTDFHARTSIFPGVEQGVLILVCHKRAQSIGDAEGIDIGVDDAVGARAEAADAGASAEAATATPALVSVAQAANEEDLPTIRPFSVAASLVQLGAAQQHVLLKARSREDFVLLGKLWASGASLPLMQLGVHTGRLVWNRHKGLLTDKRGGDTASAKPQSLPVIYAPSVHRYRFEFPSQRNNRQREHLLFGQRDPALDECATSGEVLLIQRTTSRDQLHRLIATLLPSRFAAEHPAYLIENHVNFVDRAVVNETAMPLAYVLGLLNSRLINYVFAALNGTTQVSAVELRLLPLLYPGPDEAAKLAALVQCRLQVAGAAVWEVEAAIDRLVYGWYSLSPGERSLIDQYHAIRHTAAGSRVTETPKVGDSDGAARGPVHALAGLGIVRWEGARYVVDHRRLAATRAFRGGVRAGLAQAAATSREQDVPRLLAALPKGLSDEVAQMLRHDADDLRAALIALITGAQSDITLISPFWDAETVRDLDELLERRLAAGLTVTILGRPPKQENPNAPREFAHLAWKLAKYPSFRALVWEEPLVDDPFGTQTFHFKALVVDTGRRSYLGTANLTLASLRSRMELGVILEGEPSARLARIVACVLGLAKPFLASWTPR